MTEAEWLKCDDLPQMLRFLRDKVSDRKLALLTCGWIRLHWHSVKDELGRGTIEETELAADGLIQRGRSPARKLVCFEKGSFSLDVNFTRGFQECSAVPSLLDTATTWFLDNQARSKALAKAQDERVRLLRCVVGRPLQPVVLGPGWLTTTVVALAQAIYAERAFDRLPILADALEDAGCDDADLLAHCRGDGPHVRGCWAVDLVLGKS